MDRKTEILITNDDGIRAKGLETLAGQLGELGKVTVVAPESEQSASSHSITLNSPLRIKKYRESWYSVSGSPADCVIMAIYRIMAKRPDIIVSGVNDGPNMGEDVIYSGTVGAAIEGHILGIDSMAVSVTSYNSGLFEPAAGVARYLAGKIIGKNNKQRVLLNVNVPPLQSDSIGGISVTKLGSRVYNDLIIEKYDPRGKKYFWIGGGDPGWKDEEKTDFSAVKSGRISVTPLTISMTDYSMMIELESWNLDLGDISDSD
ncbi:MAG: 5'/3'-nucleotidase SurE [Candidatus Latescibacteria bacterium]|nr:5'/3'-nucleotidase SurE [bacterium]MBD3423663.1 5'/3'-nucleotidase SurE [Candidatus Latescibacterota bacterium]